MKKPKTKTVVDFADTDAEVYNALALDEWLAWKDKELAKRLREIRERLAKELKIVEELEGLK